MDSPTSTENPQASEILATAPLTPMCCGTSQAAKLLHLSVGTVQSLVERKQLRAWKTQGGHRRIDMQSILNYQTQNQMLPALTRLRGMRLKVLVVDDDPSHAIGSMTHARAMIWVCIAPHWPQGWRR